MVAHLILASYVAILVYHVVYSGTIGNRRTISTADIGAAAAKERSVRTATRRPGLDDAPAAYVSFLARHRSMKRRMIGSTG